jgi:hypothetical protein
MRLWVRAKIFCCDRNEALLKNYIVIEKTTHRIFISSVLRAKMKFYVLRPLVSVWNEVNIFGPHLQIRLVRRGDTTCSFGLLRLNTTRQTINK